MEYDGLCGTVRYRISHPELLPDLLAFLDEHVNLVVQRIGRDELAVGVLGSFADGGAREFAGYVAEWATDHPGVAVLRVDEENATVGRFQDRHKS